MTVRKLGVQGDGLYQVTRKRFCAGFVIKDGRVTMCAPILRRALPFWKSQAVRIGP